MGGESQAKNPLFLGTSGPTGPSIRDASEPARRYVEFLRGLMTAHVMRRVAENLVPEAKALHALETILAIHLRALEEAVNTEAHRDLSI